MKLHKHLTFAIALGLAILASPVPAQTQPSAALAQSVQRYAEAWGSRDANKIVALHSADSVFHLFVDGSSAATGTAAIKAQFQKILSDNPGYSSTVRSVLFGDGHVVIEYDIKMDPPRPFTLGNVQYVPSGRAYVVPAIDVIWFKDGLVTAKHTYLDSAVARANSKSAKPIGNTK
jgi:hypothetical protein